jgi:hypothetical protein
MSKIAIKNIIHRNCNKKPNYLIVSPSINNLFFLSFAKYSDAMCFTKQETNIDSIYSIKNLNDFSYNGIITDVLNDNIIKHAISGSLPIYFLVHTTIEQKHLDVISKYNIVKLLVNPLSNPQKIQHPQIISVPVFQSMNRADNKSKKNKIALLSYNMAKDVDSQVKSLLDANAIQYRAIEDQPLSIEFLFKTLLDYEICIDISEKSIVESLVAIKTNTYYVHSNFCLDFGNNKFHMGVSESHEVLDYIKKSIWSYNSFDEANRMIDAYLSDQYFTELQKYLSE